MSDPFSGPNNPSLQQQRAARHVPPRKTARGELEKVNTLSGLHLNDEEQLELVLMFIDSACLVEEFSNYATNQAREQQG